MSAKSGHALVHCTCPLFGAKRTCRSPRAAPVHRDTQVDCLTLANRTSLVSQGCVVAPPAVDGKTNPRVCHGQLRALIILIQDAGDLSVYCATSGANGRGDVFVNNRPTSAASPARRHWGRAYQTGRENRARRRREPDLLADQRRQCVRARDFTINSPIARASFSTTNCSNRRSYGDLTAVLSENSGLDPRREAESSHDLGRCLQSCRHSECRSSICSTPTFLTNE
jgi:hypothetical protein